MKYILTSAGRLYPEDIKSKLEKFGFKFGKTEKCYDGELRYPKLENEDWEIDGVYVKGEVEINTLEELQSFIKEWGKVIVDEDSICIYDGWVE
jgi:hypothetical protein